MNYHKIYNNLIRKHSYEEKPNNGYYELHHVIPACMGGSNDKDNLKYLSGRCHLLAHWVLCRMHPNNIKLVHAFFMMCTMKNSEMDRNKPNIKILAEARKRKSEAQSKKLKGKRIEFNTPEAIKKRVKSAIKNGSYKGLKNGKAKPVDVYNYFSGELIAENVSVTEWGRENGIQRNLNATIFADRSKKSTSNNRHHAKGHYVIPHGSKPYEGVGGEYLGIYSNQGHIGLKKKRK